MSTNEELAITSPLTDKQLIDDNLGSSSMTRIKIKYGNKNNKKQSEDQKDLEEDASGIPLSVFDMLIDSVIKLDPDIDAEPNVPKVNMDQTAVQGLTSEPDQLLDFHPNIDYDEMINSGEIPVCPEKIADRPELERPVTRNNFRSESQCSEGPVLNIKGKQSYFRLNLDVNEEFLSERSVSHESSIEVENFNSEEKEKPGEIEEPKKNDYKDDSAHRTSSASQSESDHSEKNDYLNMINQEIYSIVNAITPDNLKAIDVSEENISRPVVLESDIKPMVIEDSDAHCIFGWSLLSPGVMEIKINPESDDSNDIIRVRRTSSLQCHIESGDITKLNILKENENNENSNDNGDMDYVDFIEYLAQASNRGQIDEIREHKVIIKEVSRINSTEQEVKNILQETTQKVEQQITENENLLLTEVQSEAVKTPDVKLDSEVISEDEEETLIVPEGIAKEKSLVSIKVVESVEKVVPNTHSIDTQKSKKDGKKMFPPLKKWFKSKKLEPSPDDTSKKPNEGKKNKSWFRFWF